MSEEFRKEYPNWRKDRNHFTAIDPPPKVTLACLDESRTRQSEADACDVNRIMAKYLKTGLIPQDQREAFFADVSTMPDYREALNRIGQANEFFMSLPAKTRAEFENDPALFLDACSDPERRDQLVELGLLEKDEALPIETSEPAVESSDSEPEVV